MELREAVENMENAQRADNVFGVDTKPRTSHHPALRISKSAVRVSRFVLDLT